MSIFRELVRRYKRWRMLRHLKKAFEDYEDLYWVKTIPTMVVSFSFARKLQDLFLPNDPVFDWCGSYFLVKRGYLGTIWTTDVVLHRDLHRDFILSKKPWNEVNQQQK